VSIAPSYWVRMQISRRIFSSPICIHPLHSALACNSGVYCAWHTDNHCLFPLAANVRDYVLINSPEAPAFPAFADTANAPLKHMTQVRGVQWYKRTVYANFIYSHAFTLV
jgi:hypothetical protein